MQAPSLSGRACGACHSEALGIHTESHADGEWTFAAPERWSPRSLAPRCDGTSKLTGRREEAMAGSRRCRHGSGEAATVAGAMLGAMKVGAPPRGSAPHRLRRAGIATASFLALGLLWWIAVAGPTTAYRIVVHNASTGSDHLKFPVRTVRAPPESQPLPAATASEAPFVRATGRPLRELLGQNQTLAFVALRDGKVVAEHTFAGHGRGTPSMSFSVSKSILSVLVGMAIDDGLIGSVDDPVTRYLPETAARGFDSVRLRDLLTMSSGSDYHENANPFGVHARFYYTPRLEGETLAQRRVDAPGTVWRYKSGDAALLALVLARALNGRTISSYAQERLWAPLGMEYDARWIVSDDGLERTWCCLAATAIDLARVGQLMLDDGRWRGQQLVSREWVRRTTAPRREEQVEIDAASRQAGFVGYGGFWWLLPDGAFAGVGHLGQYLYVQPGRRFVVVRLGSGRGSLRTADWLSLFRALADDVR